jgi:carbon storage regulator
MLILTRKPGESLYIGDDVVVTLVEIKGNQVRLGIEAPSHVRIYRKEIYLQILEENKKAAEPVDIAASGLEGLQGWQGASGAPGGEPPAARGRSLDSLKSARVVREPEQGAEKPKAGNPEVVLRRKKNKPGDE